MLECCKPSNLSDQLAEYQSHSKNSPLRRTRNSPVVSLVARTRCVPARRREQDWSWSGPLRPPLSLATTTTNTTTRPVIPSSVSRWRARPSLFQITSPSPHLVRLAHISPSAEAERDRGWPQLSARSLSSEESLAGDSGSHRRLSLTRHFRVVLQSPSQ